MALSGLTGVSAGAWSLDREPDRGLDPGLRP